MTTPAGGELARAYHDEVVRPLLLARWPGLAYAAGRLGSGSDVLGLDDVVSRDHDWGLRLNVLLDRALVEPVRDHLAQTLPDTFAGFPTRFATTWDPVTMPRVQVDDLGDFAVSRLGLDPRDPMSVADWLGLTGQSVLELTAGPVFHDDADALAALRRRLAWYPDDLWRHLVAVDWQRLAQEMPLMARAGERGDDLGSRVIGARLVGVAMHLGFLLERRWPPYPKWLGTSFGRLPRASASGEALAGVLAAPGWQQRQASLVAAVGTLHTLQHEVGLPADWSPTTEFWDRGYRTVPEGAAATLRATISDPLVRRLPAGVGSVEQLCDNVDVLTVPERRLAVARALATA